MGYLKEEQLRKQQDEPRMDAKGTRWTRSSAPHDGECGHCNQPYRKGERVFGGDNGEFLHDTCMELNEGYLAAISKDD